MVKGQTQCHSDQVLVSDRLLSHDASINQVWSRLNDIRDMLRYKISTDKVTIIEWLNTAIT